MHEYDNDSCQFYLQPDICFSRPIQFSVAIPVRERSVSDLPHGVYTLILGYLLRNHGPHGVCTEHVRPPYLGRSAKLPGYAVGRHQVLG